MTRRKLRLAAIAAAGVAAAALVVVSGTLVDGNPHVQARKDPKHGADANLVPATGAYLGAYVKPAVYTPQAQIEAVRSFERLVGHPLNLVHVYHPWTNPFPSAADMYFVRSGKVLLLTWGGTPDTKAIANGRFDRMIRARAEAVKRLRRPILLEFRHEMDRPNLRWAVHSPADFIAAWDHVRAIFAAAGVGNASWVWCPTAQGFNLGRAQAYYPGNSEVDWVCADVYSGSPSESLGTAAAGLLTWASHHDKPILIGEFGVAGNPALWAAWLSAAGQLVSKHPQIKGLVYYNANGEDYGGNHYAYSINGNPSAISAFSELLGEAYFRPKMPAGPGIQG